MKVLTVRGEFEKSSSATGSVVEEKTMPVVIEPVVEKSQLRIILIFAVLPNQNAR